MTVFSTKEGEEPVPEVPAKVVESVEEPDTVKEVAQREAREKAIKKALRAAFS